MCWGFRCTKPARRFEISLRGCFSVGTKSSRNWRPSELFLDFSEELNYHVDHTLARGVACVYRSHMPWTCMLCAIWTRSHLNCWFIGSLLCVSRQRAVLPCRCSSCGLSDDPVVRRNSPFPSLGACHSHWPVDVAATRMSSTAVRWAETRRPSLVPVPHSPLWSHANKETYFFM